MTSKLKPPRYVTRNCFPTTSGECCDPNWVRPEVVVEVSYLAWTEDGLLRHVVYWGERQDKPAREVVRQRTTEG
jgi:ATP-dependent DNA ligase